MILLRIEYCRKYVNCGELLLRRNFYCGEHIKLYCGELVNFIAVNFIKLYCGELVNFIAVQIVTLSLIQF